MEGLISSSMDSSAMYSAAAENSEVGNGEESDVTRVQLLIAQRLNEVTAKKEELELNVKAIREERRKLEKEVANVQIDNAVLKSTTERIKTENSALSKTRDEFILKVKMTKEKLASLPSETFTNQQKQLDAIIVTLNSITSMFAQFKSPDAIENAINTKLVQTEQMKKKAFETEQKATEIEERIIAVNKSVKQLPLQTMEALVTAVSRDIADLELRLAKEAGKENQ